MNIDKILAQSQSLPPLAQRMRPETLDEYVGQKHLIGKDSVLYKMMTGGNLGSFILWGPPGVGKTTLARIIANSLEREFHTLSAISSGVKDVREIIDRARNARLFNAGKAPLLFIDEIHRFSKAQQDALLGAVEDGTVILVGATTENPSFEVITPLLSRCQVFVLKPLDIEDLKVLLDRALKKDEILSKVPVEIESTAALFRFSGGDARKLLGIIEMVVNASAGKEKVVISDDSVTECLNSTPASYDKDGEMHYDIISAFIKSLRGSDPNAAVYYMSRMLEAGEDPLFIARRMCILAAEDVGLANVNALSVANATFQICHQIGMPEARIPLAECAIYLASSPKSNSAYKAIAAGLELAGKTHDSSVPLYLRNAPTKLMQDLGYADGYKYAHDYPGNFADLEFMPSDLSGTVLYTPQENKTEEAMASRLELLWPKYYSKKEK